MPIGTRTAAAMKLDVALKHMTCLSASGPGGAGCPIGIRLLDIAPAGVSL
jgi:hypothetical protein